MTAPRFSTYTCLAILALTGVLGFSQPPALRISLDSTKNVVGLAGGPVLGPVRCDDGGNVYLRGFSGGQPRKTPLVRIDADGSGYKSFDVNKTDDESMKGALVHDFAIRGSEVYLLAGAGNNAAIVSFSPDGEYKKTVRLDHEISPSTLGVFPSGEFFISGVIAKRTSPLDKPAEFSYETAMEIVDRARRKVANVKLASSPGRLSGSQTEIGKQLEAMDLSLATSGPEGVYFLSHSNKPRIEVISATGEVSRSFEVSLPTGDFRALALHASAGQIMIEFVEGREDDQKYSYRTYNALTGELLFSYELAPKEGGIFACYDWRGGFVFLSSDQGRRVLRYARAR